jgi:eukaryotic-like serine/threonine-protein kinase
MLVSGRVPEGMQLFDQVLAAIGEPRPRSVGAAKRVLAWRWLLTLLRGTRFRIRHTLDARPVDHLRLDLYRSASLGLGMTDVLPGAMFQARAVLVALRVGDLRRVAYAVAYHAMYLGSSGIRVPWARRLVARAHQLALESKSEFLVAWANCAEGIVEFFAGNYPKAIAILEDAEVVLRDRSVGAASELNQLRVFITFSLRRAGDYAALREKQTEYLRDAIRRGDRYAAAAFQWASNVVWVAADEVGRARADLAPETWSPPEQGIHLQHWFRQRGLLELALYEDDRAALPELGRAIEPFIGPAFSHVEAVYTETRYLLARIAIIQRDPKAATRAIRKLRRSRAPNVRGYLRVVVAGIAVLEGKRDAARKLLEGAIVDAEACGMISLAALARRRLGQLAGGEAGARTIAEADEVLRARGVADPARFARIFSTWPD